MRTGKCWFEKGDFDHFGMFWVFWGSFWTRGGPYNSPSTSKKSKMMQTKKMRTGKCWFEKGNVDHFGMCIMCFRAHFGPGRSLKQPHHVFWTLGGGP